MKAKKCCVKKRFFSHWYYCMLLQQCLFYKATFGILRIRKKLHTVWLLDSLFTKLVLYLEDYNIYILTIMQYLSFTIL